MPADLPPLAYINRIADLGACPGALNWLRAERHPDLASAWAACPRGDWMLWLAGRLAGPPGHPSRTPLILAACDCVEMALTRVPEGEDRPRIAIETARRWARGEATLGEVRKAANAAYAIYAAEAAADAAALSDAAYVAKAAYAAAEAAYATYATYAYVANRVVANRVALARSADIVRRYYPTPPEVPDAR